MTKTDHSLVLYTAYIQTRFNLSRIL